MLVGVIYELNFSLAYEIMQNDLVMKNVAAAIEKEGISAFRFDFSGNGYVSLACFIIVLHR